MPKQYPKQVRDRAVRMVLDHLSEYDTLYLACKAIASKVGVGSESLRRWARQAQVDAGVQPGTTSNEQARLKEIEREVRDRLHSSLGYVPPAEYETSHYHHLLTALQPELVHT